MIFQRLSAALVLVLAAGFTNAAEEQPRTEVNWEHDAGKPAPRLVAAGWIRTPVSLEAVKGNTVVLAFWNLDVAWC